MNERLTTSQLDSMPVGGMSIVVCSYPEEGRAFFSFFDVLRKFDFCSAPSGIDCHNIAE